MRIRKPLIVAATLALAGTLSLSACGGDSSKEAAPSATATEKAEGGKGFQEYPVGDDQIGYGNGNVGEINVSLVYFQPVDMEPAGMGLKASEASFHLEADISGLEGNDLGYGAGDFVPGLTVDYTITNKATNTVAAEGTFMQMNASDGPHYGGNIALPDAGEYTLALKIHSPEENGWMLHSDEETGVKGRFWTTPIELSWDWNYTPQQW